MLFIWTPIHSLLGPDAATYAHVAGRCGRVGQAARGVVTTLGGASDRDTLEAQLAEVGGGAAAEELVAPPAPEDERERPEETGALV